MFDRRRTIDELEALTGVSWSSCQRILTELHMKRVAAKFVPCLLLEDQRANRLDVCREMKDQLKTDPDFFSKIITGDESWCYGYDPETKQHQVNGKVHHLRDQKKARQVKSNVKTMLICFFDIKGFVHFEFVPQGQTVNEQFCLKCSSDCVMLCEENAPNCGGQVSGFCITTMLPPTQHWVCGSFSRKTGWQRLRPPPPYSPDLAPCDFFLFPRMKRDLKEKRFQNVEEVRKKRRRHWRLSLCKSSRTVLNNGKGGGISVLILKDSILRAIKFWKCSEKYTIKKKSRYFWVPPRMYVRTYMCMNVGMYGRM